MTDVIQADREAAAAFVFTIDYNNPDPNVRERWEEIGAETPIAKAFAAYRHRLSTQDKAHTAPEGEQIPWLEAQALIEAAENAADWIAETRKAAKKEWALDVIHHDTSVAPIKAGVREMRKLRQGVRELRKGMGRLASLTQQPTEAEGLLREAREALEPFGNPDILMQIADDDGDEWAKFRLLVSDYRRAGRALALLTKENTNGAG